MKNVAIGFACGFFGLMIGFMVGTAHLPPRIPEPVLGEEGAFPEDGEKARFPVEFIRRDRPLLM